MPKNIKPPTGNPPGNPPSGPSGGGVPCCACPVTKQVVTNNSMYCRDSFGVAHGLVNKCNIAIQRTNTGGTVTLTKSFQIGYDHGATANAHQDTIKRAISNAMNGWTRGASKFKVNVQQPGCPPQNLNMVFREIIVSANADVEVRADNSFPLPERTNVLGKKLTFYLRDAGNLSWTMMHEIGHTFGLPDEYWSFSANPIQSPLPTVTHLGSPPQSNIITTLYPHPGLPGDKPNTIMYDFPSVMGQSENWVFLAKHFYWVAIEVRRMMPNGTITQII